MDYQDLEIQIRSTGKGTFDATVAQAPFQERPRVVFEPPISHEALEALVAATDGAIRARLAGRDEETAAPAAEVSRLSPREIGQLLHQAVFRDELGDLLLKCEGQGSGLRLRLKFDLNDQEAPYLAALPWELLCDPKSGTYLATNLKTPVVRDLAHPQPLTRLEVKPPLRVLVVDAAPATMTELKLELEIERLEEALRPLTDSGAVQLCRLAEPSPEAMRDALRDHPVHVLHFMGHGGFDPDSKMGSVVFSGKGGERDQVDGETLAAYLQSIENLRLVVLNSCKSARHAGHAGAPLYHGVASAVVERTGMPAVLANQYAISDEAAIAFSAAFYQRLAAGDEVDTALSEARLRSWRKSPEWATPVLFLSAPDGKLFDVRKRGGHGAANGQTLVLGRRSRPKQVPLRLGIRSRTGLGKEMEERSDHLLDLVEYFDPANDRYILDRSLWQAEVFPRLRSFLLKAVDERRRVILDFAAHQSIAFAAGWVLEAKSGLDVWVWQRTGGKPLEWGPDDKSKPDGPLWLERPDVELVEGQPDLAASLTLSNAAILDEVKIYVAQENLPVGRIVDAVIAPEPQHRSVKGGEHSLRLAQALVNRLRTRRPSERGGRLHLFGSAPNAFFFYLGQLSRSLGRIVLYEYPFDAENRYGRYQPSIELPPPDEVRRLPPGW